VIVFQVKGRSHRLSTLTSKEKDVIKNFSTYSINYTDTVALERQLSQARSKPNPVNRVRTAYYIGVHIMCTIAQSWSNNLPSYPPGNHHSSDVVCWRGGELQFSSNFVFRGFLYTLLQIEFHPHWYVSPMRQKNPQNCLATKIMAYALHASCQ